MKKNRIRTVFMVLLIIVFIVGASIVLFPNVSNSVYVRKVKKQEKVFDAVVSEAQNVPEKKQNFDELYNFLKSENERLYETGQSNLTDPFSYEQPTIDLTKYGLPDNIIGYITIDRIGVTLPIYLGANTVNMELGAVQLTETSYPIGGENTNSVIAGHRGAIREEMFRNIHKVKIGDRVVIKNFRETLNYDVAEIRIIDPTDIKEVLIQSGRDLVTLVSCNPLGYNYQRYVVFCERVTG